MNQEDMEQLITYADTLGHKRVDAIILINRTIFTHHCKRKPWTINKLKEELSNYKVKEKQNV